MRGAWQGSHTGTVRKQYHFWPAEDGTEDGTEDETEDGTGNGTQNRFDAWDVDRLLVLTRDLPVRLVDVESITEVDSVYWFDDTERPTVRSIVEHVRLIQEVDTSHPIILGADGRVMDGMHRIARAMLEGRAAIPAVRLETHPEPDYRNCRPDELPY